MTHPPPESRRAGDACDRIPTPEDKPTSEPNRSTSKPMSVREMAREAGVSVGMISMALRVQRERPELLPLVMSGKLTLSRALGSMLNGRKPDRYAALIRAWNRCTDAERVRFYEAITEDSDG